MADRRRRVAGYSNPAIGQAFENVADIFAPPSGSDLYGYTRAGAEKQKAQRLADVYARATAPGATIEGIDLPSIAAGLYAPNASGWAVRTKDETDRRGQDIASGDNRYNVDSRDRTSRANNTDDNTRAVRVAGMTPIQKDAVQHIDPTVAAIIGAQPGVRRGIVAAQPGERNVLPDGTEINGTPKPLTETELKAQIIAGMTPEEQRAIGLSGIPNRPVYGTPGGTARQDPVTGKMLNTQTTQELPVGTQATDLGSPQTTVNVGPGNEPVGNPPPNMAWKRTPDGKVAFDERGAPIALPIGGTPLALKQQEADNKKGAAAQTRATSGNVVVQDIDRAVKEIRANPLMTSGVGAQVTGGIGGTPARNVKGLIDSVKANVGFDRLQQMRAESPTGGALGQVSNREMELLTSTLGSLDQAQGDTQLVENLERVKDITLDIVHGGEANGQPTVGPPRSYEELRYNKQTGQYALRNGKTGEVYELAPDGRRVPLGGR